MSLFKKLFGSKKQKLAHFSTINDLEIQGMLIWKKGKENPFTTIESLVPGKRIEFTCPVCQTLIGSQSPNYDPILGGDFFCPSCGSISHVPAALFTKPNPTGLKITASVIVPISEFSDWYRAHPIYRSLIETKDQALYLYEYYGLMAYCAKCYYRYKSAALEGLPKVQLVQKHGGQFLNLSSSEKSAKDMNALISGNCPSCGCGILLAIMIDIPNEARKGIEQWLKDGSWPE